MNSIHRVIAIVLLAFTTVPVSGIAQDELRGMFRLSQTTADLLDAGTAQELNEIIPIDEELQWQVYVPQNYDRQKPAGAFVFVDPGGWGGMPDEYRSVFDSLNMIWIGANQTASRTSPTKAMWMTMLGSRAIQKGYAIDLNRLYLGGTGEGVLTAINAMLGSSEFAGVVQISGSVNPANIKREYVETLQRKFFVFMTSNNDKARTTVRADYESYKKAGFENVKLIYDLKGSRDVAKPELIDEAIRYLDSRLN